MKPVEWRRNSSRSRSDMPHTCWPSATTSPLSGGTRPDSTASRVDLPEADGAISRENSPPRRSRETSSRATTRVSPLPKVRLKFRAESVFTGDLSAEQGGGIGLAQRAQGGG